MAGRGAPCCTQRQRRKLGDTGREADHQIAAFPRDRAQCRLGIVATDRIEDNVRAGRADGILELLRKRLLRVAVERTAGIDDCLVGSGGAGRIGFLR